MNDDGFAHPQIRLDSVTVDLPVVGPGVRSLRRRAIHTVTGGKIARYRRGGLAVRALDNISLCVNHGDRVGLYGPNGAGKTTLLRVLAGGYEPTRGRLFRRGQVASLLNVSLGIDPGATGYENITMRGLYLGMRAHEVRRHVPAIAEFAGLGDYLALATRTYSSGMKFRLAFAVCTCFDAEIVLMDEWISEGDGGFMAQAEARMAEFVDRAGILVLASQDTALLSRFCTRGVYLDHGRMVMQGSMQDVLQEAAARGAARAP